MSEILIFLRLDPTDGESTGTTKKTPDLRSQERAVVHEVARQVGLHSSEREGDFMVTKNG